jgi:hypothetical protein
MKILALYYTQTGQLKDILFNIIKPLCDYDIDIIEIKPVNPYPFPWTAHVFFDIMPETVLEIPIELHEVSFKHDNYDLIILSYQPWFLSPSLPITSLLKLGILNQVLRNKPVITVIGSRNMWINSQRSIKKQISESGGILIANIPLADKHSNVISAATILFWMLTGKKTRMLKIFPFPGISQYDIQRCEDFGLIIKAHIENKSFEKIQESFINTNRIVISSEILFIEKRAKKFFLYWAIIINKTRKNIFARRILIEIYKYYLIVALFIVAPIVIVLYKIFRLPFTRKLVAIEKNNIYMNKF